MTLCKRLMTVTIVSIHGFLLIWSSSYSSSLDTSDQSERSSKVLSNNLRRRVFIKLCFLLHFRINIHGIILLRFSFFAWNLLPGCFQDNLHWIYEQWRLSFFFLDIILTCENDGSARLVYIAVSITLSLLNQATSHLLLLSCIDRMYWSFVILLAALNPDLARKSSMFFLDILSVNWSLRSSFSSTSTIFCQSGFCLESAKRAFAKTFGLDWVRSMALEIALYAACWKRRRDSKTICVSRGSYNIW